MSNSDIINIIEQPNELAIQVVDNNNITINESQAANLTIIDDQGISTIVSVTEEIINVVEIAQIGLRGEKGEDGISPIITVNDVELTGNIELVAGSNIILETNSETNQITFNATGSGTGDGDKSYIHYQSSPEATWIITHNLVKYPSVTIVDSANSIVIGNIQYNSLNQLTVSFSGAFAGRAYLN
jgi:hypothetical protein